MEQVTNKKRDKRIGAGVRFSPDGKRAYFEVGKKHHANVEVHTEKGKGRRFVIVDGEKMYLD